jgi:predicted Rossmann-fold nucleotide-binding protein
MEPETAGQTPPPPERLYSSADLFGEWSADRPASAGETFDFRTYVTARRLGLRTPISKDVAIDRAMHDTAISWLLDAALDDAQPVAIMGGHRIARDDPTYRVVAELANALVGEHFFMLSGGGPGAMEATHLGARCHDNSVTLDEALDRIGANSRPDDDDAARFPFHSAEEMFAADGSPIPEQVARLHRWQAPAFSVAAMTADRPGASLAIPTWLYGHEPSTPLATAHAKYFENSIREDGLLAVATSGVVFAPGRAGTLQEVFQDAAQNYYTTVENRFSPMVFLDVDEYWTRTFDVRSLLDALFDDSQEANVYWVATADEALSVLCTARTRQPKSLPPHV